ncbi:hypothetical protein FM038_25285 [Shewanella eurypsychrophilus]|uniref:Uncharacterized protein n=1 Tax=Shewanella eurypsychrophilus TaxID=2593656 RepID=A0ABX8S372_9GAMM|nr:MULTISPECIES: hypothetical protein [Shewanella]QXP44968.1 hypothetical protein FM038_25285 [Shewanella eurypsychrophilus]
MKQWSIILCCAVFVIGSLLTSGLVRALIDLGAFTCLLWIVLGYKSTPVKQSKLAGGK